DLDGNCLAGPVTSINENKSFIARITQQGLVIRLSQIFDGFVRSIRPHASRHEVLYALMEGSRVWTTNQGTTTQEVQWTELAAGRPAGAAVSLAAGENDGLFLLMARAVASGVGTTPLFKWVSGQWTPQRCTGLPSGDPDFGKMVAHPDRADMLYVT